MKPSWAVNHTVGLLTMLRLADTSIRLYRKKDGTVSVRWRSFLMIHTNVSFRLSAYLNKLECSLTIADGPTVNFDEVAYSDNCIYGLDHMVYDIWASGTTPLEVMRDTTIGILRVEYLLFSFGGQDEPSVIELVVPVVARGSAEQRFGARYRSATQVGAQPRPFESVDDAR